MTGDMREFRPPKNLASWIALSVAIPVALVIVSDQMVHRREVRQAAGIVAPETSESLGSSAAPPTAALPSAGVPPLQQGVTANEASETLQLGTARDVPAYDHDELTVSAGEVVQLEFSNLSDPSFDYRHGWVLVKPGTATAVGEAANLAGAARDWVPSSPDVLARTRVIGPGETDTVVFRAPAQPGDYPYLCPVMRHWTGMHGVLHVTP